MMGMAGLTVRTLPARLPPMKKTMDLHQLLGIRKKWQKPSTVTSEKSEESDRKDRAKKEKKRMRRKRKRSKND